MLQEGAVALVLSLFDKDLNDFAEVDVFTMSDQQSSILTIVQGGTYTLSIQPIASTQNKFGKLGLKSDSNNFASGCFRAHYTFTMNTINLNDSS
jgi:hypothetical protein